MFMIRKKNKKKYTIINKKKIDTKNCLIFTHLIMSLFRSNILCGLTL
jgi:hypothetical protein